MSPSHEYTISWIDSILHQHPSEPYTIYYKNEQETQVIAFIDLNQKQQSISTYLESTCPGMIQLFKYILLEQIHEHVDKVDCMDVYRIQEFKSFMEILLLHIRIIYIH